LDGGFDICSTGGFAEIMLKEIEMVSIAKTKYVRISPKKLRLIVDILKDQPRQQGIGCSFLPEDPQCLHCSKNPEAGRGKCHIKYSEA
jgi:hypothetical protein